MSALRAPARVGGLLLAACLAVVVPACPAFARIVYLYDDLDRLVRVIREDGEAATYHYDAVGNILRITRESGVPQTTVVSAASTSPLPRSQSTTITFTGFNCSGATITASSGVTLTGQQTDVDTLVVQVTVDPTAALGRASLTITTPYGTVDVPLTIIGGPPIITASSESDGM